MRAQIAFGLNAVLVQGDDREPGLFPLVQPVAYRVVVLEKQLAGRLVWRSRHERRHTQRVVIERIRHAIERAFQPKNARHIVHGAFPQLV